MLLEISMDDSELQRIRSKRAFIRAFIAGTIRKDDLSKIKASIESRELFMHELLIQARLYPENKHKISYEFTTLMIKKLGFKQKSALLLAVTKLTDVSERTKELQRFDVTLATLQDIHDVVYKRMKSWADRYPELDKLILKFFAVFQSYVKCKLSGKVKEKKRNISQTEVENLLKAFIYQLESALAHESTRQIRKVHRLFIRIAYIYPEWLSVSEDIDEGLIASVNINNEEEAYHRIRTY